MTADAVAAVRSVRKASMLAVTLAVGVAVHRVAVAVCRLLSRSVAAVFVFAAAVVASMSIVAMISSISGVSVGEGVTVGVRVRDGVGVDV
jgi:hypothetical protein